MVAGCAPKLVKLTFFVVNIVVWVASIGLIGISSWLLYYANNYEDLFEAKAMYSIIVSVLCTAIFLFLLGFCGCCGAMRESTCMLTLYFILMTLIVLTEATGTVLSFVYSTKIEDSMTDGMTTTINKKYGENSAATNAVDDIQNEFECCGATNYTDYETAQHLNPGKAVPESCCKKDQNCTEGSPGNPDNPDRVHDKGCVDKTFTFLRRHVYILAGVCVIVLLTQFLLITFTCCLISAIKNDEYEHL